MTLEQDVIDQAAKQMANDIDIEIIMNAVDWKPFELSEGRVYGARYLTVHPNNSTQWNEMMAWMVETFGPSAHDGVWTPSMRWYANNAKFWFREEKDRNWFVLKWSS
jgi:hypothetical protein